MDEIEIHEMNGIRAEHHRHMDSILLTNGVIAYGFYEEGIIRRKVTINGTGKILRIDIEGIDGYVDVNLQDITNRAVEILVKPLDKAPMVDGLKTDN